MEGIGASVSGECVVPYKFPVFYCGYGFPIPTNEPQHTLAKYRHMPGDLVEYYRNKHVSTQTMLYNSEMNN